MSSQKKRTLNTRKSSSTGAILLCLFGAAGARAQEVWMPPPAVDTTPPAVQAQQQDGAGALPPLLPPKPDLPQWLRWGPVDFHPHPLYRVLYGEGIQSGPGSGHNTFIQEFSPGVLVNIGTHWSVDYTPTLSYYSDKNFKDTVGHSASLNWGTAYEDWIFHVSQSYLNTDTPLIETGIQTQTQSYNTSVGASYRFNSIMSTDMSAYQSFTDATQFTSSKSWNTLEWLNFQVWPRFSVSAGAGFGYDSVSAGNDMSHETLQARISWRVADKLSVVLHGGAEDRQYIGSSIPNAINPTYGAAIEYEPFEHTLLTLSADRAIQTSLFQNFATENTDVNLGLSQRLLKNFNLSLGAGYSSGDYLATAATSFGLLVFGRSDTHYTFTSRLAYQFLKRASAAVTYQYSENKSNIPGFSYTSNQIGLELGYNF